MSEDRPQYGQETRTLTELVDLIRTQAAEPPVLHAELQASPRHVIEGLWEFFLDCDRHRVEMWRKAEER